MPAYAPAQIPMGQRASYSPVTVRKNPSRRQQGGPIQPYRRMLGQPPIGRPQAEIIPALDIIVKSDDVDCMRYPGGKFRCYQKLINLIPPHRVYIETHLGGGAVIRHKSPAEINIGVDPDPRVIRLFLGQFGPNFQFLMGTAEAFLKGYPFEGDEFVYADPPYWPASRRSVRSPYRHSYTSAEHIKLLQILCMLPCPVMISGYGSVVYDEALAGWKKFELRGTSHTGARNETVWLNYQPSILHDTRFLGGTFRERQAVKRKRMRWSARFRGEPPAVQQAILTDLVSVFARHTKRSPLRP
jgi:hypothetical protein